MADPHCLTNHDKPKLAPHAALNQSKECLLQVICVALQQQQLDLASCMHRLLCFGISTFESLVAFL